MSTYLGHGGEGGGGHRILTLTDDKINVKILIVNIYLAFNRFCLIFLTQKLIVQAPRKITAENESFMVHDVGVDQSCKNTKTSRVLA